MTRTLRAPMAGLVLALAATLGCAPAPGPSQASPRSSGGASDDGVAAYVGDKPITRSEVQAEARGALNRLEQQRYDAMQIALDRLVDARLLADEAARRGITIEELQRQEVDDRVIAPSDAELLAEWKAKGAQMARGRTFEQVRHFIVADLTRARADVRRGEFLAELREGSGYRSVLEPPRFDVPIPEGEPTRGSNNATVTVVEFSDYECPYCKQVHDSVERLLAEYGDRIRFVYRDYPLDTHTRARPAAQAARCAGEQGKYWDYHRNLMTLNGTLGPNDLRRRAGETELDLEAFTQCMDSKRHEAAVERGFADGNALGLRGTPTFFVNGVSLYGVRPYEDFRDAVEAELARVASGG